MNPYSEMLVQMRIRKPEGPGVSRSFCFAGKVDLLAPNNDGTWTLVDWKTVSDPSQFITQKTLGHQADLYALALADMMIDVSRIEYRLVRTPSIKLCGKDADAAAYEERCVAWLTEEPGRLLTHYIDTSSSRILTAKTWLWYVGQRILECRRRECYLCNEHACYTYNRACPYLPLCTAQALGGDSQTLVDTMFEPSPRHRELEELPESDGLSTLTYSAASTLTLCEMKYYWRYERAIRPCADEVGEAAWTGSAMHAGMDALAKTGDEALALDAIRGWADANPVMGADCRAAQEQNVARARAMCRVAALKWLSTLEVIR